MQSRENLEESKNFVSECITSFFKKVKPIYVVCGVLPLIFLYPKPLMLILKPIIRNWSFHYKKINEVKSKPLQIILTSDPRISFSKEYLRNFQIVKGPMPEAFSKIQQSIISEELLNSCQDESMKHVLVKTKHEFQKQIIFNSCYVIDMQDTYMQKSHRPKLETSFNFNERKKSHCEFRNDELNESGGSIYGQIDYIWVEMILMKLKVLQIQNNSEVIKYVIIKANERVLQLLESKILGIKENDAFKLGVCGLNKIHLLKFNKNLDTYEQCSSTFKIQQTVE